MPPPPIPSFVELPFLHRACRMPLALTLDVEHGSVARAWGDGWLTPK
jgi:hypothetical protein